MNEDTSAVEEERRGSGFVRGVVTGVEVHSKYRLNSHYIIRSSACAQLRGDSRSWKLSLTLAVRERVSETEGNCIMAEIKEHDPQ